jgi:hypothetical protein
MLRIFQNRRSLRLIAVLVLALLCVQITVGGVLRWYGMQRAIMAGQVVEICSHMGSGVTLVSADGSELPHQPNGGQHCPFCQRDDFTPLFVGPVDAGAFVAVRRDAVRVQLPIAPIVHFAPPERRHAPPHAPPLSFFA